MVQSDNIEDVKNHTKDSTSDISNNIPTVLSKLQKWGDYASVGEAVWPSKFIPMKTPLSVSILENWTLPKSPKHRLTVPEMLEEQAKKGRRIGLIMDLSNHDCLYSNDIPSTVEYLHVHLIAKELPPVDFVRKVASLSNAFWTRKPNDHIAIHCAYGFNRTGFVVCCYLIDHCGLSIDEALNSFGVSRPPGVKHEQFRNELRRRYDPNWISESLLSPQTSRLGSYVSCKSSNLATEAPPSSGANNGYMHESKEAVQGDRSVIQRPSLTPSLALQSSLSYMVVSGASVGQAKALGGHGDDGGVVGLSGRRQEEEGDNSMSKATSSNVLSFLSNEMMSEGNGCPLDCKDNVRIPSLISCYSDPNSYCDGRNSRNFISSDGHTSNCHDDTLKNIHEGNDDDIKNGSNDSISYYNNSYGALSHLSRTLPPKCVSLSSLREIASPNDDVNQSLGCSPSIFLDENIMRLMREESSRMEKFGSRTVSATSISSDLGHGERDGALNGSSVSVAAVAAVAATASLLNVGGGKDGRMGGGGKEGGGRREGNEREFKILSEAETAVLERVKSGMENKGWSEVNAALTTPSTTVVEEGESGKAPTVAKAGKHLFTSLTVVDPKALVSSLAVDPTKELPRAMFRGEVDGEGKSPNGGEAVEKEEEVGKEGEGEQGEKGEEKEGKRHRTMHAIETGYPLVAQEECGGDMGNRCLSLTALAVFGASKGCTGEGASETETEGGVRVGLHEVDAVKGENEGVEGRRRTEKKDKRHLNRLFDSGASHRSHGHPPDHVDSDGAFTTTTHMSQKGLSTIARVSPFSMSTSSQSIGCMEAGEGVGEGGVDPGLVLPPFPPYPPYLPPLSPTQIKDLDPSLESGASNLTLSNADVDIDLYRQSSENDSLNLSDRSIFKAFSSLIQQQQQQQQMQQNQSSLTVHQTVPSHLNAKPAPPTPNNPPHNSPSNLSFASVAAAVASRAVAITSFSSTNLTNVFKAIGSSHRPLTESIATPSCTSKLSKSDGNGSIVDDTARRDTNAGDVSTKRGCSGNNNKSDFRNNTESIDGLDDVNIQENEKLKSMLSLVMIAETAPKTKISLSEIDWPKD